MKTKAAGEKTAPEFKATFQSDGDGRFEGAGENKRVMDEKYRGTQNNNLKMCIQGQAPATGKDQFGLTWIDPNPIGECN